jgi:hypothetical protein
VDKRSIDIPSTILMEMGAQDHSEKKSVQCFREDSTSENRKVMETSLMARSFLVAIIYSGMGIARLNCLLFWYREKCCLLCWREFYIDLS